MKVSGTQEVTENYELALVGETRGGYSIFKVNNVTTKYPILIDLINHVEEVEGTTISYLMSYMDAKPFPNDQGTVVTPVSEDGAWWVGDDYDLPEDQHLEYLALPDAWGITTGTSSVIVGVIDSGMDWGLDPDEDLPMDNRLGYNAIDPMNHEDTYPDYSMFDNGHGTAMTSIICSKTNNNLELFGIAGGWKSPDEGDGITPMMLVNGITVIGFDPVTNDPIYGVSSAVTPLCIDWATYYGARIINTTPLNNEELAVHNDYSNLLSQIGSILLNHTVILGADSADLANLSMLAQKDDFMPGAIARNILHAAGLLAYTEPINLGISLRAGKAINPDLHPASNVNSAHSGLAIYPNPATDYCIMVYNTGDKPGTSEIQIHNASGLEVGRIRLKDSSNTRVQSLSDLPRGTYVISLLKNNEIITTSQIVLH